MLRKCALLFLLLAITPAAAQARPQNDFPPGTLHVFVEGDPSATRAMIEALRRSDPPLDFKLVFVSAPADRYQVRLIVSGGSGNAWCTDSQPARYVIISFSNVVALAPDGKLLFTVVKTGESVRQPVGAGAKETIRQLLNYYRGLKENRPQPDADAAAPEKQASQARSIEGLPSEPGIYRRGETGWARLNEALPSGVVNRGLGAAMLTWGISGIRVVQIYNDPQASVQIPERKPSFYVRGFGLPERDAQILRLERKKKHREVQVASVSPFNPKHGHRERDIYDVEIERISDTVIRISPASDLEPGEYILRLSKSDSSDGGYEFSVTGNRK